MTDIVDRMRMGEPCIEASAGGRANDCKVKDASSGCWCAAAADEIERLRAQVKRLEDSLANASWQREYDEVMGRNGSGMDGGW